LAVSHSAENSWQAQLFSSPTRYFVGKINKLWSCSQPLPGREKQRTVHTEVSFRIKKYGNWENKIQN